MDAIAPTQTPPSQKGPTQKGRNESQAAMSLFDRAILVRATRDAFTKLNPVGLARNPVIFVTEIVAALTTVIGILDLAAGKHVAFAFAIAFWLWLTVLFATFAEAVAEGRGRARAESLRRARSDTMAKLLPNPADRALYQPKAAQELRAGDIVLVEINDLVPSDGEIVEGIASVNESAITGESAPVIREAGGDRSAVTGGTLVVSDWIVVRITADPGSTFIDRMIKLVEGAERRKTPNEIALDILLAGLTLIFLMAVVTLPMFASYSSTYLAIPVLAALFVTLIPTTIGGLLSAIGIAGMDRLIRFNVVATSGRAVEAAGDVDALLLDKTGTITFGNRMASSFTPVPGVGEHELAQAAALASLGDETPEGRSILALAREKYSILIDRPAGASVVPFSASTRLSGVDYDGHVIRKGAVDQVLALTGNVAAQPSFTQAVDRIARAGSTPLAVASDGRLLGAIELKDVVKPGIRERFAELRNMGIRTVMVTGDNRVTAAAIATEAGVDDFIAEATPQDKLSYIRKAQAEGRLVAMCGDGTNDAPALAQADVGVAMQTGHPGRARSRQHGRPRQRSDQAHRDRADRQAAADHARLADHVLHRQRRLEIFRDPACDLRDQLSSVAGPQHHAPLHAGECHHVGRHLQRADHRGARAAGAPRRQFSRHRCCRPAAAQPADLRRRRPGRTLHRHQGDRPRADRPSHLRLRPSQCSPSSARP